MFLSTFQGISGNVSSRSVCLLLTRASAVSTAVRYSAVRYFSRAETISAIRLSRDHFQLFENLAVVLLKFLFTGSFKTMTQSLTLNYLTPGRAGPRPKNRTMALPKIDVQRIFTTAREIVRNRQVQFFQFAPGRIRSEDVRNRIAEMVSALEKQDTPPYRMEKCFLADFAVMATRVLEAYSLDDSGLF